MNKSELLKNKVFTGVLFAAACFVAAFILIEFHGIYILVGLAAVLLLSSATVFFGALFNNREEDAKQRKEVQEQIAAGDAKHMDQKYLKEITTLLAKQNELMSRQIERLENEMGTLAEKQIEQTKTLIKYNKENVRQLAISERETLEHVMHELKKAIEEHPGVAVMGAAAQEALVQQTPEEEFAAEEFIIDEIPESELFEMPETLLDDEGIETEELPEHMPGNEIFFEEPPAEEVTIEEPEFILPEEPEAQLSEESENVLSEPEFLADQDIDQILDMLNVSTGDAPVEEAVMDMPEEPAADAEADFPDLEELLGMMNEDVQPKETVVEALPALEDLIPDLALEEPAAEEPAPEPTIMNDPIVAANPNAVMTPDEIAKLLEAMGN